MCFYKLKKESFFVNYFFSVKKTIEPKFSLVVSTFYILQCRDFKSNFVTPEIILANRMVSNKYNVYFKLLASTSHYIRNVFKHISFKMVVSMIYQPHLVRGRK